MSCVSGGIPCVYAPTPQSIRWRCVPCTACFAGERSGATALPCTVCVHCPYVAICSPHVAICFLHVAIHFPMLCCNPLPYVAIHSHTLPSTPSCCFNPPPTHKHCTVTSQPVPAHTSSVATSTVLLRSTGRRRGWISSHPSYS